MYDKKQALAKAVREARKERDLSPEKLAEALNMDTRTILNIEAGRGNLKFEKLCPIIEYLEIPPNLIFSEYEEAASPAIQKLHTLIGNCTEQETADLLPAIRYLLNLTRRQSQPTSKPERGCRTNIVLRPFYPSKNFYKF